MSELNTLILMATGGSGAGGSAQTFLFFAAILLVMYFFMIRPQTKKAKAQRQFVAEIKNGDKIVTLGGVHGTVTKTNESTLIIESEGTALKIEKSSVSLESTKANYSK